MQFTMRSIMIQVGETLRDPATVAKQLMPVSLPRNVLWLVITILSVLTAILGTVSGSLTAPAMQVPPFTMLTVSFALLVVTIFLSQAVCRLFGGTGTTEQAMLLLSWQHFVIICLQVIGFIASLILAPLGGFITLAVAIIGFWQMAVFLKVLHGFSALNKVIGGMLAVYFSLATVLAIIILPMMGAA